MKQLSTRSELALRIIREYRSDAPISVNKLIAALGVKSGRDVRRAIAPLRKLGYKIGASYVPGKSGYYLIESEEERIANQSRTERHFKSTAASDKPFRRPIIENQQECA
jgi:hypothetical protein